MANNEIKEMLIYPILQAEWAPVNAELADEKPKEGNPAADGRAEVRAADGKAESGKTSENEERYYPVYAKEAAFGTVEVQEEKSRPVESKSVLSAQEELESLLRSRGMTQDVKRAPAGVGERAIRETAADSVPQGGKVLQEEGSSQGALPESVKSAQEELESLLRGRKSAKTESDLASESESAPQGIDVSKFGILAKKERPAVEAGTARKDSASERGRQVFYYSNIAVSLAEALAEKLNEERISCPFLASEPNAFIQLFDSMLYSVVKNEEQGQNVEALYNLILELLKLKEDQKELTKEDLWALMQIYIHGGEIPEDFDADDQFTPSYIPFEMGDSDRSYTLELFFMSRALIKILNEEGISCPFLSLEPNAFLYSFEEIYASIISKESKKELVDALVSRIEFMLVLNGDSKEFTKENFMLVKQEMLSMEDSDTNEAVENAKNTAGDEAEETPAGSAPSAGESKDPGKAGGSFASPSVPDDNLSQEDMIKKAIMEKLMADSNGKAGSTPKEWSSAHAASGSMPGEQTGTAAGNTSEAAGIGSKTGSRFADVGDTEFPPFDSLVGALLAYGRFPKKKVNKESVMDIDDIRRLEGQLPAGEEILFASYYEVGHAPIAKCKVQPNGRIKAPFLQMIYNIVVITNQYVILDDQREKKPFILLKSKLRDINVVEDKSLLSLGQLNAKTAQGEYFIYTIERFYEDPQVTRWDFPKASEKLLKLLSGTIPYHNHQGGPAVDAAPAQGSTADGTDKGGGNGTTCILETIPLQDVYSWLTAFSTEDDSAAHGLKEALDRVGAEYGPSGDNKKKKKRPIDLARERSFLFAGGSREKRSQAAKKFAQGCVDLGLINSLDYCEISATEIKAVGMPNIRDWFMALFIQHKGGTVVLKDLSALREGAYKSCLTALFNVHIANGWKDTLFILSEDSADLPMQQVVDALFPNKIFF